MVRYHYSTSPYLQIEYMASIPSPRSTMPDLDLIATAKITRKTLERLAPFSHMQSTSGPAPQLTKMLNKIGALISLIDSSMLVAQIGYQLATNAMILFDREESDWEADVTVDSLKDLARQGANTSKQVADGFREIKQEVYKIAAATKDSMLPVVVPPHPTHSETLKMQLKDVGTDLVANVNLLSQFSQSMSNTADWWAFVDEDLSSEAPTLLALSTTPPPDSQNIQDNRFARWSNIKQDFQEYYDTINVAHVRFPDLLPSSSGAWRSVALARSVSPTSIGHPSSDDLGDRKVEAIPIGVGVTKGKGMKHLLSMLGISRYGTKREAKSPEANTEQERVLVDKGKAKETQADEAPQDTSRHGRRSTSSNSPTSTLSGAVHEDETREGAKSEDQDQDKKKKKSALSESFSGNLFGHGVGFLCCHGLR